MSAPRAGVDLARSTIAHHSKSFSLASRLLPRAVRDDAVVVYAWCRRADDAIDLESTESPKGALAKLRRELDGVYAGHVPSDPVLSEMQRVVHERRIPREYPQELLAGMEMDAIGWRYETLDDLLAYCFRVAGTVGLMMCHVMGVSSDRALRHAAHLGMAMQLTNVSRDVLEDWNRGRLYLPADLLEEHGALELRNSLGRAFPREMRGPVAGAVAALLRRADALYRSGDAGTRDLSGRCAFAVRAARRIYAEIGLVLGRRGHDVLSGRAVVSTLRKLWLVARAGFDVLAEWPRRARHGPERLPEGRVAFPADVVPVGGV